MRRLVDEFRASERRVCGLMEIPRMSYRYRYRRDDSALRERLLALAREYGVSKHTIYAWKSKYGGMEVSEAQEVKQLREENTRLKKLVADLSLDKDMLQSVIRKNSLGS